MSSHEDAPHGDDYCHYPNREELENLFPGMPKLHLYPSLIQGPEPIEDGLPMRFAEPCSSAPNPIPSEANTMPPPTSLPSKRKNKGKESEAGGEHGVGGLEIESPRQTTAETTNPKCAGNEMVLDHITLTSILPTASSLAMDRELVNCKAYIIDTVTSSYEMKLELQRLLHDVGWPTMWQSLETVRESAHGLEWTWAKVDDDLLVTMRDQTGLSWAKMAESFFIGMTSAQCEQRYNLLTRAV